MILPQQLQNKDFRFVLINKDSKAPFQLKWQSENNFTFFNHNVTSWNKNLGVVCGYGNLVVVDIDDRNLINEFDKKTNTFTVRTGSGKRHYYFICKDDFAQNYYVLGNKQGELRIKCSQVVCPGSIHPETGNTYTVLVDIPIREVNKEELKNILGDLLIKGKITDQSRSGLLWGEVCSMIKAGYNFDNCDDELRLLGDEKWINEKLEYRITTYCNALRAIKGVR